MKNYDITRDCPPGAKYINKTKSGFRLIPGDRCQATDTSKNELKSELVPCSGHEKESGYDNEDAARRAVCHHHHHTHTYTHTLSLSLSLLVYREHQLVGL